jgi:hypothetical protein
MRADSWVDGLDVGRVVEVEGAVREALGDCATWFRSDALPGLAFATVAAGPELPFAAQLVLAKLGAWICAFDDLVDCGGLDDDALARQLRCYEQLTFGVAREPAADPVVRLCASVIDSLMGARLGASLSQLLFSQLIGTCEGMRRERQLLLQRRAGAPITAAHYLGQAADSVGIGLATTAAAILIGEEPLLGRLPSFRQAQRHAAMAVRLANDLATWSRDQAEETSANLFTFLGEHERARAAVEDGIERELDRCAVALDALAADAPVTSRFVARLTTVLVATYRRGDLDQVNPSDASSLIV